MMLDINIQYQQNIQKLLNELNLPEEPELYWIVLVLHDYQYFTSTKL